MAKVKKAKRAKKAAGGYRISFKGRKETLESVFGSAPIGPPPPPGGVYVITSTGLKRRSSHVAAKATAKEIVRSLGIKKTRISHVKSIVDRLEARGRIKGY